MTEVDRASAGLREKGRPLEGALTTPDDQTTPVSQLLEVDAITGMVPATLRQQLDQLRRQVLEIPKPQCHHNRPGLQNRVIVQRGSKPMPVPLYHVEPLHAPRL
ncbi:MAG: hypothetical protein P8Y44_11155, partial [Acidobacteriota bacterium]